MKIDEDLASKAIMYTTAVACVGTAIFLYYGNKRDTETCDIDKRHSLRQLMLDEPRGSGLVPSDVLVQQGRVAYRPLSPGNVYSYPSADAQVLWVETGWSWTVCRIRDQTGRWWMVNGRSKLHPYSYFPADQAQFSTR